MRKQTYQRKAASLFRLLVIGVITLSCLFSLPLAVAARNDSEAMAKREPFRYEGRMLCPGGVPFGVKFTTDGVLVVGISAVKNEGEARTPAADAGICVKDILTAVDGKATERVKDVAEAVAASEGKAITITLRREGEEQTVTLTPVLGEDGVYHAGLWLRDSTAGIGTVTYVEPETGAFGGLGHGICDVDTGVLMPLKRGSVMKVVIGGVVKGQAGQPGEIKGYFRSERSGTVLSNTVCGVFGVFAEKPSQIEEAIPVGSRYEVKEGQAEVICTLGDDGPQHYTVTISKITRNGTDNKNFVVTVTDAALIERTGGIVQGMSGSPIIQNGKLIGAVTHVLINDPTRGYGIFIENMLDTAA
ncbi:MAG: SpoIVB peptidase [Ruminococcaceae bacterium]|nr:SpoIVB peptidase [Oscillospiraceae bacterium]